MKPSEIRQLSGASAGFCVANLSWWLQPVLMQQLMEAHGWSESAAGLALSAEIGALALAAAASARAVPGLSSLVRLAAAGTVLAALAAALSTLALHHPVAFVVLRLLAGAGAGVALTLSNRIGATLANPDRGFAWMGIVNVIFGVALMATIGYVPGGPGTALFWLSAGAWLLLLPLLFQVGRPDKDPQDGAMLPTRPATLLPVLRIAAIVATTFAVGLASGIVWVFYAVIGQRAGLPSGEVEGAIGLAIFAAGAGSVLAAIASGRWSRTIPPVLMLLAMGVAVLALTHQPTVTVFRAASCLHMASIYFLFPYFLGAGAAEHESGRGAAYVGSAFFLAGALGPVVGGWLVESAGIEAVGVGIACVALIACAVFFALARRALPVVAVAPR